MGFSLGNILGGLGGVASVITGNPLFGAIGGAIGGMSANEEERRRQQRHESAAERLTRRQSEIFEMALKAVQDADAAGTWDPEKQIAQLDKDFGAYESRDAGNLAGALRVGGHIAGDSEIGTRLDSVKRQYRTERDRLATGLRRDLPLARAAAYAGVASGTGALNPGIGYHSGQQANIQNPTNFLASVMPYLKPPKPGGNASAGGFTLTPTPSMSGGYNSSGGFTLPVKRKAATVN